METHPVSVKSIMHVTHDVIRIRTAKPKNYHFEPGQATEVSIDKDGWREERRPFTFTGLPTADYLEFTIKTYPAHDGVTNQLLKISQDDTLILHDVFGTIQYKGGGVFIAGGAGVTPFIAIFRHLQATNQLGNNKLIFANKTRKDIILESEFQTLLGKNFINILSEEEVEGYAHGYITAAFLEANIPDPEVDIYLCGPEPMMEAIEKHLSSININAVHIIKEAF